MHAPTPRNPDSMLNRAPSMLPCLRTPGRYRSSFPNSQSRAQANLLNNLKTRWSTCVPLLVSIRPAAQAKTWRPSLTSPLLSPTPKQSGHLVHDSKHSQLLLASYPLRPSRLTSVTAPGWPPWPPSPHSCSLFPAEPQSEPVRTLSWLLCSTHCTDPHWHSE